MYWTNHKSRSILPRVGQLDLGTEMKKSPDLEQLTSMKRLPWPSPTTNSINGYFSTFVMRRRHSFCHAEWSKRACANWPSGTCQSDAEWFLSVLLHMYLVSGQWNCASQKERENSKAAPSALYAP